LFQSDDFQWIDDSGEPASCGFHALWTPQNLPSDMPISKNVVKGLA
jgi:hypothetical protein